MFLHVKQPAEINSDALKTVISVLVTVHVKEGQIGEIVR